MQKLLYLLLLILFPIRGFCGGLSAWTEQTPYNNSLYYPGTGNQITFSSNQINQEVNFTHFYFYHGYIIAQNEEEGFYLINEKENTIQSFTEQQAWKQEIKEKGLNPLLKRLYDSDYSSFFGTNMELGILVLLFFPFPFLFPILWIIALITIFFKKQQKRRSFRKVFIILYPSILLVLYLLFLFPQSL
ncbi:MAG: hypothetical protein LBE34_09795 [Flavobacteriaceae bacterium]|jgi:hypothetical protein|nr:hypothetical protein [Flavobacteriaceae bacterium]